MSESKIYAFKGSRRSGRCVVEEHANRVHLNLQFDSYGDFGDTNEIMVWLLPIVSAYESDPRPLSMVNPTSGEVVAIGNGKAVVWKPPSSD